MTPRRRLLNTTMAAGVLAGAGILAWSVAGSEGGDAIPPRPQVGAIHVTVDVPTADPLPEIRVPELTPRHAPEPGRTEVEIRVSPRPSLRLAELRVPDFRDEPPSITLPDLRRPLPPLPRPSGA